MADEYLAFLLRRCEECKGEMMIAISRHRGGLSLTAAAHSSRWLWRKPQFAVHRARDAAASIRLVGQEFARHVDIHSVSSRVGLAA
jgi:hypothetical protein